MARLVRTLTRKAQPQFPFGIGEIAQASRRALQAIDLLVHLPVGELDLMQRMIGRQIGARAPTVLDVVARITRRSGREQRRVEGRLGISSQRLR